MTATSHANETAADAASAPATKTSSAFVIKLGGRSLEDAASRDALTTLLADAVETGARIAVVHGGGAQITDALKKAGVTPTFVDGLRVTDAATIEVVESVLTVLGKRLAQGLGAKGAHAVGLTGRDAELLRGIRKAPGPGKPDLGLVGSVVGVNAELLRHLYFNGVTPVIAPLAVDADGNLLNVNADEVASAVAQALGAKDLVLLTDVDGVRDADGAVVADLGAKDAEKLLVDGVATGGMVPKLRSALDASHGGVKRVTVANGASPATLAAILRGERVGTIIRA